MTAVFVTVATRRDETEVRNQPEVKFTVRLVYPKYLLFAAYFLFIVSRFLLATPERGSTACFSSEFYQQRVSEPPISTAAVTAFMTRATGWPRRLQPRCSGCC